MPNGDLNFNAKNQQVQVGNNNTQTQNIHESGQPSLDDLLTALKEAKQVAIDEDAKWLPDTPQAVQDEFPTVGAMFDAATTKVEDVATGYAGPGDTGAPALGTPESDFLAEKESWFNKFNVLPPKVIQGGLVVGEAVLSCYVSKSPVVAGALAAIEFFKS